jgi:hypothetical protein
MSALIISENYLKEYSIINNNADMKVITPTIQLVQDIYIHPILGSDLYDEIITQINSNTVTSLNQTLLDSYVIPCMLWYVLCECTPVFKYRYMNKGVMVKNSENSTPADLNEIQFLMDKWKNNAEVYAERITKYLRKNASSYPEYTSNPDYDDIKPNKSNYETGIYLDDSSDDDCNIIIGNYE